MPEHGLAIAVAGISGAGKTTAASAARAVLSCESVSYGAYLRTEARRRDLTPCRSVLRDLGLEMIAAGWDAFTASVLDQAVCWKPGEPLVIEGVRHRDSRTSG